MQGVNIAVLVCLDFISLVFAQHGSSAALVHDELLHYAESELLAIPELLVVPELLAVSEGLEGFDSQEEDVKAQPDEAVPNVNLVAATAPTTTMAETPQFNADKQQNIIPKRLISDAELKRSMAAVYDSIIHYGKDELTRMLEEGGAMGGSNSLGGGVSVSSPSMLRAENGAPSLADQIAMTSVVMSYAVGELVSIDNKAKPSVPRSLKRSPSAGWNMVPDHAAILGPMLAAPIMSPNDISVLNNILSQLPITPASIPPTSVPPMIIYPPNQPVLSMTGFSRSFPSLPIFPSGFPQLPNIFSAGAPPASPIVPNPAQLASSSLPAHVSSPPTHLSSLPAHLNNINPITAAAKLLVAHLAATEENHWLNALMASNPVFGESKRMLGDNVPLNDGANNPGFQSDIDKVRWLVEQFANRMNANNIQQQYVNKTEVEKSATRAMRIVRELAPTLKDAIRNYPTDRMFSQIYLESAHLLLQSLDDKSKTRVLTGLAQVGRLDETSFNDLYLNNQDVDENFKPAALLLTRLRSALNIPPAQPSAFLPPQSANSSVSSTASLPLTAPEKAIRDLLNRLKGVNVANSSSEKYRELRRNGVWQGSGVAASPLSEDIQRPFRWFPPAPPIPDLDFQGKNWARFEENLRQRIGRPFRRFSDFIESSYSY